MDVDIEIDDNNTEPTEATYTDLDDDTDDVNTEDNSATEPVIPSKYGEPVNYDVHPDDEDKGEWTEVTRKGRKVYKPKRIAYETNNTLTTAEHNYYEVLTGFDNFADEDIATTSGA